MAETSNRNRSRRVHEDSSSDISTLQNSVDKKALLKLLGFVTLAVSSVASVGTSIFSVKKTADISDDMSSQKQALPDAKQLDQMIAAQQKTITNENALWNAFVLDSGAMDFGPPVEGFQFSAGKSHSDHQWGDYNQFCKLLNGTLASPFNKEQFIAMSVAASKKGHCFIGASRQNNGADWKSPDNIVVSLTNYWAPKEPSGNFTYLCAYLFNDGKNSFLYSSSCDGTHPKGINCFLCSKRTN
ncbi:uncharacterized protein LOC134854350 [Symsagittifera roscoffensis]|uniref:uncharacterized protein LOC134854350 n=1 Tax=Symsagittifera roscoffensis TaxID=84072 RepID=UPI00307C095A